MTEKLARRGLKVPSDLRLDLVTTTLVSDVMTSPVTTLPPDAPVGAVMATVERTGHGAYPLVDQDGALVGIIARGDLLESEAPSETPVIELARLDVVVVRPGETVAVASRRMIAEGVDHLPVVTGGRLVGMCTRTDLVRAQSRVAAAERREDGWLPRLSSRPVR